MKVLVNGAMGRMGLEVTRMLSEHDVHEPAALVDLGAEPSALDHLYQHVADVGEELPALDVMIDFSHHTAVAELLPFAVAHRLPVVIATTGHTDGEKAAIRQAAEQIPVFFAANMSLGVAALCAFAKKTAALFPDADIEIVEKHHTGKLDAPSGTALMIASAIQEARPDAYPNCGRNGMKKREKNEIGIASLRLGSVVGEHEVILTTGTQTITLKHEAHSRSLFAEGAIAAAEYLLSRNGQPGLYSMTDMVGL